MCVDYKVRGEHESVGYVTSSGGKEAQLAKTEAGVNEVIKVVQGWVSLLR